MEHHMALKHVFDCTLSAGYRRSPSSGNIGSHGQQLAAIWSLRLLINGGVYKHFLQNGHFTDEDILDLIGLTHHSDKSLTYREALKLLQNRLAELERKPPKGRFLLAQNIADLSNLLKLSFTESQVLAFLILIEQFQGLYDTIQLLAARRNIGGHELLGLMATALRLPKPAIHEALSARSTLRRCGLIKPERHGSGVELMRGLDDMLMYSESSTSSLLRHFTQRASEPNLTPDHFAHVSYEYVLLRDYIRACKRRRSSGANILIYGSPGTGKTEMVRTLAGDLAMALYEVKYADPEGRSLEGAQRFSAYLISQQILRTDEQSAVLFDEVEDVFNDDTSKGKKAWVNQMLESNPRPTFWISNGISNMDSAFLRRFDLIIEMPPLSNAERLKIARKVLDDLNVSEQWLSEISEQSSLEVAHLARSALFVKRLGYRNTLRVECALQHQLGNLQRALGHQWKAEAREKKHTVFNPALSNTDFSIEKLAIGLKRSNMGRVCLYGPPGTGKSALGQYIKEQLGKPLVMKKASDLLGSFIGENERNLAAAFDEAKENDAILMIDEADSFLASRTSAVRNWEVTQVNELLVQMEQFEGILIMSTNFMEHLDSAALRRFDFKIRFDYLTETQALSFTNSLLERPILLGHPKSLPLIQRLKRLTRLTPGDFNIVTRRHKIMGEAIDAESLLRGLEHEHKLKKGAEGRPIGFTHS